MPVQERVRSLQETFINANGLRGCRNEQETFADDRDLDLILVGETKLQAGVADHKIRGFVLYRSDRDRDPGGGTAIYVQPHTIRSRFPLSRAWKPPRLQLRENDFTEILDTGISVIAAGDFNAKHQAGVAVWPTATAEFCTSSWTRSISWLRLYQSQHTTTLVATAPTHSTLIFQRTSPFKGDFAS
jgi:hypothetical protein